VHELSDREQAIRRLESAFATFQDAQAALANDPNDAEANLTAGRWHGFVKGDWQKAMPLLAKGSDVLLAQVAQDDLAQRTKPEAQAELADAWWNQCLKETGPTRSMAARRAVLWYNQALSNLTGLRRIEATKSRLEALSTVSDPDASSVPGAVEEGNVALASNGTTLNGEKIAAAEYLLDGDIDDLTVSKCPCDWTITFSKVYRLQEVRLYLRHPSKHSYHYAVATSPDGKSFSLLAKRTSGKDTEAQFLRFSARPVKAIRLMGIASTYESKLVVEEFEAYCIPPHVATDTKP